MTNNASAIAKIIGEEADRANRDWSLQGIFVAVQAALEEDGRTAAQAVQAGLSAVADRTAKTPAALRWPSRYVAAGSTSSRDERLKCVVCGRPAEIHEIAESKVSPGHRHAFEAVTR